MTNKDLSPQEICINKHDGIFLVVAGPGVGKTYTVVRRIYSMIKKGVAPESILCLTFSDTAALEMKNRVGKYIAENSQKDELFGAENNINVFTYHSFCLSIMEEFAQYFSSSGYKIITDSHKRTLINECIDEIKPSAYNNEKNNPYCYSDNILEGIEEIKKSRVLSKEDFFFNLENNAAWLPHLRELEKLQEEKPTKKTQTEIKALSDKIQKMRELWNFYELYCSKMRELNYIDFYDMINLVLDGFENPDPPLLESVCEKYSYVIVDEYQDTNTSQNAIVFNLAKYIKNIFVVGDDDQIIYTFQGAHLDTVEKFLNNPDFGGDKKVNVLCFDKNFRSTQNILDLACSFSHLQDSGFYKYMLSKSGLRAEEKKKYQQTPPPKLRFISKCKIKDDKGNLLNKKLTAVNPDIIPLNKPVEFIEFDSSDNERDYIVQRISKLKEKVEKLSEIAILTRTNSELKDYAIYLKANGVPVEVTGGKNIFEINSVNCFVTYLQFLLNPEKYSDKLLSFMLLEPYHIDPADYKILCDYKAHHDSLINNIKQMLDMASDKEKLENFIKTYEYLKNYIASENYKNVLLEIGAKTGIFEYYFNDEVNKTENIKGIEKLLDEADSYFEIHKNQGNSFKLFVDYLINLIEGGIQIRLDKEDKPINAVQLSTYHSSKGREFEYVFMPALTKGKWESAPSSYKDLIPSGAIEGESYDDIVEKEHRAKFLDNIKLLYVGMTRAKHELVLSYAKTNDPLRGKLSWFIQQLIEDESLDKAINKKYNVQLSRKYNIPKYNYDYKKEFRDFVVSKLPAKFSPSALNSYRNCPKQYFYKYIMELKSQSGPQDDTSFGTAMHCAFEYTIKEVMNNKKYPSCDEVYEIFSKKADTLPADYPQNIKQAARENIFSKGKYYNKFISMVDESLINPDKKYEKNPLLNNSPDGYYEIYAEYPLCCEINIDNKKVVLNGFIDRLDKDKDGNYSIYDYKSRLHCDTISPADNYFYQMAFYKYVFEKQHPECKIIKAAFLFPLEAEGNCEIDLYEKFYKPIKESDKTLYEAKIDELQDCIKRIYNLEFDIPKKPKCDYCPYKQLCGAMAI